LFCEVVDIGRGWIVEKNKLWFVDVWV